MLTLAPRSKGHSSIFGSDICKKRTPAVVEIVSKIFFK